MHAGIAVLASMVLAFGAACSGDDPDPAEVDLETTVEAAAADRCNPTTGSGQFRDRGIEITGGTGQGKDCVLDKAKQKANYRYASRNCVGRFDPGCPIDCEECNEAEPCQTVVGLDDRLSEIPLEADDGMTCTMVDDSSCPPNAAGERKGYRCTLDGTGRKFYCSCFCRP